MFVQVYVCVMCAFLNVYVCVYMPVHSLVRPYGQYVNAAAVDWPCYKEMLHGRNYPFLFMYRLK